jgi:hypothetical protein
VTSAISGCGQVSVSALPVSAFNLALASSAVGIGRSFFKSRDLSKWSGRLEDQPAHRKAGFDLPMLRDFGLVAAMDMVLALMASLVVLPALVIRFGLPLATPARTAEETRPARSGAPA